MAYTNFLARDLTKNFGIKFRAEHLFEKANVAKVQPSSWLQETLERGQRIGFNSEKSRSEHQILKETMSN